ncbi:MAG: NADH-quinone oxidoreductase subunit NuoB [Fibrobacter sp.]|jgi:NADH-quinone oxidoreductase subunit B|nr:NADH-quinone oxidoreductase subunit NuoB [Fibrobacter sp.]
MTTKNQEANIFTSSLDFLVNWGRKNSLWPFPYGTACCAIEFMSSETARYDLSRIGSEYVRFTPRQSDVLLVAGTITYKQAPILKRIYEQMAEPRWVIAMGACASSGGFYDCYCTVPGIDHIIPVDIFIGGCPPRPESFFDAMFELQNKVADESYMKQRAERLREQVEALQEKSKACVASAQDYAKNTSENLSNTVRSKVSKALNTISLKKGS